MTARTAIVTGAARGIGLATAKLFLSEGRSVAMVDRDGEELLKATDELKYAVPLVYDISQPEQVEQMMQDAEKHLGQVDALINNAGVADFGPIEEITFERWRTIMATNLDGIFLCSQAATPALKRTKGSIVNIASISGMRASTLRVAYGTSKAAVIHLTKQYAAELGEYNIRVNCVAPGPVRTKLAAAVHSPEIIQAYHDAIPLNRSGGENEIASVVTFLCSENASYVTGQVIASDGGFDATGVGLPALRRGKNTTS